MRFFSNAGLSKPPFSAKPPTQSEIPDRSRQLIAFEKLNVACEDIENRQQRSLPIEEREARFISIRGLIPATGPVYDQRVEWVRVHRPRYANRTLLAFTFARGSRDSRIKEGDFLLALSNENSYFDLDVKWRICSGFTIAQAEQSVEASGLHRAIAFERLGKLLQVELIHLEAGLDPPFLVLSPNDQQVFRFAEDQGLLDQKKPMVIDPIFHDFSSERIEAALRLIGGNPPPRRGRK